ncbi:hypothetical protein [Thalassobellus suaedae]|uniref:Tetratricopeptide repeat protein n=1 Tax=Thalassobellus suaedae TaxID=3074124 RepID=A0ABY9XS01_9FLAO|nr:hypothetical protein RHP51_16705 [Flavobacteriaceae bacterium HL-DH14]
MNLYLSLYMFKNYFFIVLLTLFCLKTSGQTKSFKKQLDSIQALRQLSKNTDLDIEARIQYAKKASELSYITQVDSVILKTRINLAWTYMQSKKYSRKSIKLNNENLKTANKFNDSFSIACINSDLGYAYHHLEKSDSAYYYYNKSLKIFKYFKSLDSNENYINQSLILLNIAYLQKSERDYIGGQVNIIKAINLLLKTSKTEKSLQILWGLYNNLALNLDELKEYEKYFSVL